MSYYAHKHVGFLVIWICFLPNCVKKGFKSVDGNLSGIIYLGNKVNELLYVHHLQDFRVYIVGSGTSANLVSFIAFLLYQLQEFLVCHVLLMGNRVVFSHVVIKGRCTTCPCIFYCVPILEYFFFFVFE